MRGIIQDREIPRGSASMDKRQFLIAQLDEKIYRFNRDSNRHKALYRWLRYFVFFLTSLSTVLAGLALNSKGDSSDISIAILIVTALAGFLTSIEGLRKPSELWVHERSTLYALVDLKREIDFVGDAGATEEALKGFFFRMQVILGSSNEKWNRNISAAPSRNVLPTDAAGG